MSNLTTYGSSTEGYNASGGFTPTSGGYNYTGGQENSSHTSLWDMVMVRKYKVFKLTRVGRASRSLSLNLINRIRTPTLYNQSGVMIKHCRPPGNPVMYNRLRRNRSTWRSFEKQIVVCEVERDGC